MVRVVLGWTLIGLGILGLFLPILQGILFLAIGVALLAPSVPAMQRLRDWFYRRFPHTRGALKRLRRRFHH